MENKSEVSEQTFTLRKALHHYAMCKIEFYD